MFFSFSLERFLGGCFEVYAVDGTIGAVSKHDSSRGRGLLVAGEEGRFRVVLVLLLARCAAVAPLRCYLGHYEILFGVFFL